MRVGSALDNPPKRVVSGPVTSQVVSLLGEPLRADAPVPQVFAFHSDARPLRIESHYHVVDQYQVVLCGEGTLGSTKLAPIGVHYVDAYTPYGPIDGPEDMVIVTVRSQSDSGARYVADADARAERRGRGGGRHFYLSVPEHETASDIVAALRTPEPDGVAVHRAVLSPVAVVMSPHPAATGGLHCIVLRGALRLDGRDHPAPTDVYLEPTDGPLGLVAGDEGVDLLFLAFRPRT